MTFWNIKRKTKKSSAKKNRHGVLRIQPHRPEARDEGPRLIPLNMLDKTEPMAMTDHYLSLADFVLSRDRKKKKSTGKGVGAN